VNPWPRWPFILIVLAVSFGAHFLPPERASVSPDVYAVVVHTQVEKSVTLESAWTHVDRPMGYVLLYLQGTYLGCDPTLGLVSLLVCNAILVLSVYGLMDVLIQNRPRPFCPHYCSVCPQTSARSTNSRSTAT